MTTVDSFYWGLYQIRSVIESFKTYSLNWCLTFSNKFWGLSYFYLDRVQLKFKANQDWEKIKGSILYNDELFQSDPITRNVSFHSSFLSTHLWIIRHRYRNQNISLPFCFTSVTCLASIYWYDILLKQWKRCLNFHVLIQLPWVRPQCYLG